MPSHFLGSISVVVGGFSSAVAAHLAIGFLRTGRLLEFPLVSSEILGFLLAIGVLGLIAAGLSIWNARTSGKSRFLGVAGACFNALTLLLVTALLGTAP
jgi:hypothetical protein